MLKFGDDHVSDRESHLGIDLEPPASALLDGSGARPLLRTLMGVRGHPLPPDREEWRLLAGTVLRIRHGEESDACRSKTMGSAPQRLAVKRGQAVFGLKP